MRIHWDLPSLHESHFPLQALINASYDPPLASASYDECVLPRDALPFSSGSKVQTNFMEFANSQLSPYNTIRKHDRAWNDGGGNTRLLEQSRLYKMSRYDARSRSSTTMGFASSKVSLSLQ